MTFIYEYSTYLNIIHFLFESGSDQQQQQTTKIQNKTTTQQHNNTHLSCFKIAFLESQFTLTKIPLPGGKVFIEFKFKVE